MDYIIICTTALFVSGLTLFSGFGLGTLLMPAFVIFMPVDIAIAATAVVHLANNIFKIIFVGRMAAWRVVLKFGVAAAAFALLGAWLLSYLSGVPSLTDYTIVGREFHITPVKVIIAVLMVFFALFELVPGLLGKMTIREKYLPLGGAASGFFGGLSGHQGALRSAFLINTKVTKEQFIGTVAVIAILVDVSRLIVYGSTFFASSFMTLKGQGDLGLIVAGCGAAFIGTFAGSRLIDKVTLRSVQIIVGVMLFILALGMASGLI